LIGFSALLLECTIRIWSLNMNLIAEFLTRYLIIIIAVAFGLKYLLSKCYSETRVENLKNRFEEYSLLTRQIWGCITVLSFIAPWVAFAILLNSSNSN
jgi:hypothetical protein